MDPEPISDIRFDAVTGDDALECYRLGRDDLGDSEFAALAGRLASDQDFAQRLKHIANFDRSVQAAFADVPVPSDLAANVLLRLTESASPAPVKVTMATVKMPSAMQTRRPRMTRRRMFLAFSGLAGAAVVAMLGVVWALQRPHSLTPSSLLEEAIATVRS